MWACYGFSWFWGVEMAMVLVWIVLLLTLPLDRCPKGAGLIEKMILVSARSVWEEGFAVVENILSELER